MDILHLVDRLEEIVKRSRRVPFSSVRMVDEQRVWALIDQMRISIPDEIRRAERINQQRERVLAQAREEAERVVQQAQGRLDELTSEHPIAKSAEERATSLREQAEREAADLRSGADEYVFNTLCQLEEELHRVLRVVSNGLRRVEAGRAGAGMMEEEESGS